MRDDEPRVICGLPVSGACGIIASIIVVCQIFGLFFLSPFLLYFFEIAIGFAMVFVLSSGAKHRRLSYITAYMFYVAMYTFWVFFLIIGAILASVWLVDNSDHVCPTAHTLSVTPCVLTPFTGGDVAMVVISCIFLTISIIMAVFQLRYLLVLYHFLKGLQRPVRPTAFVQYVVPTSPSGMPPPPRYGEHSNHPVAPEEVTMPTKPPNYSELVFTDVNLEAGTVTTTTVPPPTTVPQETPVLTISATQHERSDSLPPSYDLSTMTANV